MLTKRCIVRLDYEASNCVMPPFCVTGKQLGHMSDTLGGAWYSTGRNGGSGLNGMSLFRRCGLNHLLNFLHMFVRHSIALIFPFDDIEERFQIFQINFWKLRPFILRFEPRLKLPLPSVPRDRHQTCLAFFGFLAPFVFLHDVLCQAWKSGFG